MVTKPQRAASGPTSGDNPKDTRPLSDRQMDHWAIVDLLGKGGHVRTVPVPDWVKQFLDEWFAAAEISNGKLLGVSVVQESCGATE
jgi:hypothetical protein